eukprot:scaffold89708_cov21-Cyclotella_meneghiniana.AAC.2
MMTTSTLLNKLQPAINTTNGLPPVIPHLDIFNGMTEGTAPAVANGHIALDLDGWDAIDHSCAVDGGYTVSAGVHG